MNETIEQTKKRTRIETMTQATDHIDGLYVTDKEICRRLGFGESCGRRIISQLDRGIPKARPYPQPDKMFGSRRFWPAILQWHMEYHRLLSSVQPTVQPMWQENFDETDQASKPRRTRPELASA